MRWATGGLGAFLCVAGAVVVALADRQFADVRWTAYTGSYAPLAPEAYRGELTVAFADRWTVLWTRGHLAGALLVVLSLLVLAGLTGWLLGRREVERSTDTELG